ncbi:hypothetical protein [Pectinatus frisingensis]|uniref:hypothetical protein n=1 Tax=Pectinatus frisingensis TaxID=865 RepID=UPI0018C75A81|nr:hypothetical protein [Pectinatus frisingensis]
MIPHCWRCGRILKPPNVQQLVLWSGQSVMVCADDRNCPAVVNGSRRKLRELQRKGVR